MRPHFLHPAPWPSASRNGGMSFQRTPYITKGLANPMSLDAHDPSFASEAGSTGQSKAICVISSWTGDLSSRPSRLADRRRLDSDSLVRRLSNLEPRVPI